MPEAHIGLDLKTISTADKATLTISTGDITPVTPFVIVAAQTGTTDDLDGIVTSGILGPSDADGATLILFADAGDTITIRHNQNAAATKNILTETGASITLTGNTWVQAVYHIGLDTNGAWVVLDSGTHVKYTDAEAITAVEGEATLVLAGDVTIDGAKTLKVDVIDEKDSAAGVTIENATIKDGSIELHEGVDTISTDEITAPTGGYIIAAAQTGTTDDLDGIGGGADGRIIVVRADAGDVITVKHSNAGGGSGRKILMNDNADVALTGNDEDNITLMYDETLDSANGAWFELSRGEAGSGGGHGTSSSISDHGEVAVITEARGQGFRVNSTPAWEGFDAKTAGALLGGDGTDLVSKLVKRTINLTASGGKPATTNGCAQADVVEAGTNDVDYWVLDFDDGADEFAFWPSIMMPANYDKTVAMNAIFNWTSTATDTDGVAWAIQLMLTDNSDPIDTAWGTAVVTTDDNESAAGDDLFTAESGDITPGGTVSGTVPMNLYIRVFRDVSDANDDMTEDARLKGVQLTYTVNAISDE